MAQPATITLAVDVLNNGSTVNKAYSSLSGVQGNKSQYIGPDHSMVAPHTLTFYRTFPKPSGNFRGVTKTAVKVSISKEVEGVDGSTLSAPNIGEVSFSLPVGATEADELILRQTLIAALDRDDVMVPLNHQAVI